MERIYLTVTRLAKDGADGSLTVNARIFDRSSTTKSLRKDGKVKFLDISPREKQVLQRIAEGFANKQIAADLKISIKTVEKHRQKLMSKLNIHDVAGLTRYAVAEGVIVLSENVRQFVQ